MMNTFFFYAGSAVGCTLLVAGIQLVCNNLLEFAEVPIFKIMRPLREKDNKTFFKGLLVSGLNGSTLTTISTLISLVNAGLVKVRAGLLFMAGAHLGPLILLFLFSFLNLHSALFFLSFGLLAQLMIRSRFGIWFQNTYGLFLGFGLVSLGRHFLMDGLTFFSGIDQQFLGSLMDGPYFLSLITGLFIGALLSYIFRSSLVAILLLMLIRDSAFYSLGLLLPAVIGVHALGFFPVYQLSKRGNVYSRRVAMGQVMISLIGLICGAFILSLIPWAEQKGSSSIIFTFFVIIRVSSVAVFLLFLKPIRSLIKKRWPSREHPKPNELEQLGRSSDMVPAMSLIQGAFHLSKFKNIVDRLFSLTEQYLTQGSSSGRTLAKIKDYERITDNMHQEIHRFLSSLIENSLTHNQAQTVQAYIKIADGLENIADYLDKLASYNTRYLQNSSSSVWREEFMTFFLEVKGFYQMVSDNLPLVPDSDHKHVHLMAQRLKIAAESLREQHLKRLGEVDGEALSLMTYSDMVVSVRKIRGHALKLHSSLL
jgi:phosphate:Na+ symporter